MDKEKKLGRDYVISIVLMGALTAILCVLAPLSIPLIGGIPVSLSLLVIYLMVYLIGGVRGTICVVLYILIGMVGLPVFSNYGSGIGKLAGPTGGFIIGFIFTAAICGGFRHISSKVNKKIPSVLIYVAGMILGCAAAYAFGVAWFMVSLNQTLEYALTACVIQFLPFDAAKIVIVAIIAPLIRRLLINIPRMDKVLK